MGTTIETTVSNIALEDWDGTSRYNKTMNDRFMRLKEVELATGLTKKLLYRRWKKGQFPVPMLLGQRLILWSQREILEWMEQQKQRRLNAEFFNSKDR